MVVIEVLYKGCVHQQLYKDENLAVKKAGFKSLVEVVFGDSTLSVTVLQYILLCSGNI